MSTHPDWRRNWTAVCCRTRNPEKPHLQSTLARDGGIVHSGNASLPGVRTNRWDYWDAPEPLRAYARKRPSRASENRFAIRGRRSADRARASHPAGRQEIQTTDNLVWGSATHRRRYTAGGRRMNSLRSCWWSGPGCRGSAHGLRALRRNKSPRLHVRAAGLWAGDHSLALALLPEHRESRAHRIATPRVWDSRG